MDLTSILKKYADQIGGQYIDYDHLNSVIIVPLSGSRFQTILGVIRHNDLYNRKLISLTSKVCALNPNINFQYVLEQTAFFNYCRFVIRDGFLQVEAVGAVENLSEDTVKEMIQEVANLADQYELTLTGSDIH
jgi:hypothetical protein